MRYQTNQEILSSATIQIIQDDVRITSGLENYSNKRPIGYLRFWGIDYPYLNNNLNCAQGCLPIPENSEAQRHIRKLAGYPPVI